MDRRGLWVNDARTGTRIRAGEVGLEIAAQLAAAGQSRIAREALSRPHVGVWFSKDF